MGAAICYLHEDCRDNPDLGLECARSAKRSNASRWRATWLPAMRTARWLEQQARASGLPFEVRPDWFPPAIDWSEFNQPFSQFDERVRLVARRFGAPHTISTGSRSWQDEAPELFARWDLDPPPWERRKLSIQVRAFSAADVRPARGATKKDANDFSRIKLRSADESRLVRLASSLGCTSHEVSAESEVKR